MPFGGHLYQLALAALIGIAWGLGTSRHPRDAARLGAKASFLAGAAWMLFSESRWWPAFGSTLALATWALSGWIAAWLGSQLAARVRATLGAPAGRGRSPP